jgi:hypothetical protein
VNVALTRTAEELPRRPFTADDVWRMNEAGILSESERFELVEGDRIMMAPNAIAHENIKHALTLAVAKAAPENLYVAVATTFQFTDHILVAPDLAVILRGPSTRGMQAAMPSRARRTFFF